MEYTGTVHQLFVDSEKVYDPVKGEVLYSDWSETRKCFIITAFQLCFRIFCQETPKKSGMIGTERNTSSAFGL
jgi:hypothetical protein